MIAQCQTYIPGLLEKSQEFSVESIYSETLLSQKRMKFHHLQ